MLHIMYLLICSCLIETGGLYKYEYYYEMCHIMMCEHVASNVMLFLESQPHSDVTDTSSIHLKHIPKVSQIFSCK